MKTHAAPLPFLCAAFRKVSVRFRKPSAVARHAATVRTVTDSPQTGRQPPAVAFHGSERVRARVRRLAFLCRLWRVSRQPCRRRFGTVTPADGFAASRVPPTGSPVPSRFHRQQFRKPSLQKCRNRNTKRNAPPSRVRVCARVCAFRVRVIVSLLYFPFSFIRLCALMCAYVRLCA